MHTFPRTLLMAAFFAGGSAWAAGGHHAVDDAAILEQGACEVESWLARSRGGERSLHAGASCRVGPLELGAATDYARQAGTSETGHALQSKWAADLGAGIAVGLSLTVSTQARARPRYQGTTAAALLTWTATKDLALHANLGRDFVHRGPDQNRSGLSAEWSFREGWSAIAERYVEDGSHYARAGLRRSITPAWTVDASHAARLRGPGASSWTLGVTWLPGAR